MSIDAKGWTPPAFILWCYWFKKCVDARAIQKTVLFSFLADIWRRILNTCSRKKVRGSFLMCVQIGCRLELNTRIKCIYKQKIGRLHLPCSTTLEEKSSLRVSWEQLELESPSEEKEELKVARFSSVPARGAYPASRATTTRSHGAVACVMVFMLRFSSEPSKGV